MTSRVHNIGDQSTHVIVEYDHIVNKVDVDVNPLKVLLISNSKDQAIVHFHQLFSDYPKDDCIAERCGEGMVRVYLEKTRSGYIYNTTKKVLVRTVSLQAYSFEKPGQA